MRPTVHQGLADLQRSCAAILYDGHVALINEHRMEKPEPNRRRSLLTTQQLHLHSFDFGGSVRCPGQVELISQDAERTR